MTTPTDSARWSTAVHEACHVVAVRHAGGSAQAWLAADGRTGAFSGVLPDQAPAVADAVALLAGGAGQKLIVGRDGPSRDDIRQAKRALRGTGVSIRQARRQATHLVRANRGAILREARTLYRHGRV